MSLKLTDIEIAELQTRYHYLMNYNSDNVNDPIDPLTYVDSNGDHLIHIASQQGDVPAVQALLRAGIDVNQLGDMGCTALHYARMSHQDDVALVLLQHGAALDIVNGFGKTPDES
jgi:ankyrin repeat protein